VQGLNDLVIFITMASSSFASGMILERDGWQTLNYAAIPFVAAVGVAVVWLTVKRKSVVATA
jgi:hypothetical protein